jgi:hypothetical protein
MDAAKQKGPGNGDATQLTPDAQVVPTATKYPTQRHARGTPQELVRWENPTEEEEEVSRMDLQQEDANTCIDMDAFSWILCSKSVCPCGKCYCCKKAL